MTEPLLTIGIPTLDRAQYLHRAIDSCLRNTIPVRVLVADQGHTEGIAQVMARYRHHPNVSHMLTDATCLWENWKAAADACETPYFAWLQDDDIISRGYAAQVCTAFDRFPDALHWQARCHIAIDERVAGWFSGNGPWLPMPLLDGEPTVWPGLMLPPTMLLVSWSLSPGVAFRCGAAFSDSLDAIPAGDDLYTERLILAEMGSRGPFVASPVIAGYWIHHGGNESYKQHGDQDRQLSVAIGHLDNLLDAGGWQEYFAQWCTVMPAANVVGWLKVKEFAESRHAETIEAIMAQSLVGRLGKVDEAATPEPALA